MNDSGEQEWVYHVASQLATESLPDVVADERKKRRRWYALGGVAILAVAGVVVTAVLSRGGDDDSAQRVPAQTSITDAPETSPTAIATSTTATSTTAAVAADTTVPATTTSAAPTTTAAPPTTSVPSDAATIPAPAVDTDDPVRWAEFADGIVYLRGRVPDQATADEIATKAGAVVGPDNVRIEYTIDPAAPRPDFAPLYVNDSILFAPDSAVLGPASIPTVELGLALLNLYPRVTFDIEGHTDDVGTDEYNLALSQERVDTLVRYFTARGVDPKRLTAVAKGESEPIADNSTKAGRARNRRIEIQVNNLLG